MRMRKRCVVADGDGADAGGPRRKRITMKEEGKNK